MRPSKLLITVRRDNRGRFDVQSAIEATVFGHWGAHRCDVGGWTVTHIPSGYAARQKIKTATEAKRIARALATEFNVEDHQALCNLSEADEKRIRSLVGLEVVP